MVREGRLKHLSSRHRLFGGAGLQSGMIIPFSHNRVIRYTFWLLMQAGKKAKAYDIYVNRRVSAYLVPKDGTHTFVLFSEDCRAVSSFPLKMHANVDSTDLLSTEWLLRMLKESDQTALINFAREPVRLILTSVTKLLGYGILINLLYYYFVKETCTYIGLGRTLVVTFNVI